MLNTIQNVGGSGKFLNEIEGSDDNLANQDPVNFPKDQKEEESSYDSHGVKKAKKQKNFGFPTKDDDHTMSPMDHEGKRRRKKLNMDDEDGEISVSQNTSKLPSIMHDRKSGMS